MRLGRNYLNDQAVCCKNRLGSAVNEVHVYLRSMLKYLAERHTCSVIWVTHIVTGDFNYSDINWNTLSAEREDSDLYLECFRPVLLSLLFIYF